MFLAHTSADLAEQLAAVVVGAIRLSQVVGVPNSIPIVCL
jgi:hypothetical protein